MGLILSLAAVLAMPEGYAIFEVAEATGELGAQHHRLETELHARQPRLFRSVYELDLPRAAESREPRALETAAALVRAAETAFYADDYDTAQQHLDGALSSANQVPDAGFDVWQAVQLWRVAIGLARGDEARAARAAQLVSSARPDGVLPAERFWPSLIEFVRAQRDAVVTGTLEIECPVPGATIALDRMPLEGGRRVGVGHHRFVASAPGFQTLEGTVEVDGDTQVFVYLLPALPPEVRAEVLTLSAESSDGASPILERFCDGLGLRGCIFLVPSSGAVADALGLWQGDDEYRYWRGASSGVTDEIARWTAAMHALDERGPDVAFDLAFSGSSEVAFTVNEATRTVSRFQGTGIRVGGIYGATRSESSVTTELSLDYARYSEADFSVDATDVTSGAASSARWLVRASGGYRFVFLEGTWAITPRASARYRRYSLNRASESNAVLTGLAQQLVVSQSWASLALGVVGEAQWRGVVARVAFDFDVLGLTPSAPNDVIRDLQPAQGHVVYRLGYRVLDRLLIYADYVTRFALEQPIDAATLDLEEGALLLGARYAFW